MKITDASDSLLFKICLLGRSTKTRQDPNCVLFCGDDVNLSGNNINTMEKNTEAVIYASKEVGLEAYTDSRLICT
jgi:hypothetical protein